MGAISSVEGAEGALEPRCSRLDNSSSTSPNTLRDMFCPSRCRSRKSPTCKTIFKFSSGCLDCRMSHGHVSRSIGCINRQTLAYTSGLNRSFILFIMNVCFLQYCSYLKGSYVNGLNLSVWPTCVFLTSASTPFGVPKRNRLLRMVSRVLGISMTAAE